MPCGVVAPAEASAPFTLQVGGGPCLVSIPLGVGSTKLIERSLLVEPMALDGALKVQLLLGCPSDAAGCPQCDACVRDYAAAVPEDDPWPLGSADSVEVLFVSLANRTGTVQVTVVHTAAALPVYLMALAAALLVAGCVALGWWHAKRMAAWPLSHADWHRHRRPPWALHPRWGNPWIEVGLAVGLCLVVVGLVCYAVLYSMHHPRAPVPVSLVMTMTVACAGLLLFAGAGLRAMRDDAAYRCPVCQQDVSLWRFSGTYLPPLRAADRVPRKGHTRCLRCTACARPVVLHVWEEGPAHRPYHRACWDRHCRAVCASPAYGPGWYREQEREASRAELAAMLAAAIDACSYDSLAALLAACPASCTYPLPDAPNAMHYATRAGNLRALQCLLAGFTGVLDGAAPARATQHSLLVTGLNAGLNDIYVPQPPLVHNGREVYIGHSSGQYIYYYKHQPDPEKDGKKPPHKPGWCLSPHLGSGTPPFRLLLDPVPSTATSECDSGTDNEAWARQLRERITGIKAAVLRRVRPDARVTDRPAPDAGPDAAPLRTVTVVPVEFREAPAPEPTAATAPVAVPVQLLGPGDLGLRRIPHSGSLLEAAAASGDAQIIEHVIQVRPSPGAACTTAPLPPPSPLRRSPS